VDIYGILYRAEIAAVGNLDDVVAPVAGKKTAYKISLETKSGNNSTED